MKPKQLANVLVKILGLSIGVHGVLAIIDNLIYNTAHNNFNVLLLQIFVGLVRFVIGIFLIIRSLWIVEKLFKDEQE
jgi:phosphotransferase system  glucose/maltose/N-acetylglucosamine-specific IIC component